ncbi:hypothetical protein SKZ59_15110 [Janthinobacterium sp. GMG2]|uniref:hypothetical protein n=1 Tax=Janthinobacterium sp. GMG2 TaxID=3096606 RepID=UPI0029F483C1|nr:hypothetical protein [Janthinobacterium sp. GMG2]MDX8123110.1 hypothetical protein [Janthinobacterium sp. GMG2]
MTASDRVRATRDGDQFHYLWAAQLCLKLLPENAELVAISIEGPSSHEQPAGEEIDAGDQVVDVGEYYGSQSLVAAKLIRYVQLKHSTLHANEDWTISGLKSTLEGFSTRFQALLETAPASNIFERLELLFISNRPIGIALREIISDAAELRPPRNLKGFELLVQYTGLDGRSLADFCRLLKLEGGHLGYLQQRELLVQGVQQYLPGADVEAPLQLKEMVTRKATSEYALERQITKYDVLKALGTSGEALFPAKCLIEVPAGVVVRIQESELVQKILSHGEGPTVIQADGGVGKSILAMRLLDHFPEGSRAVVYDCFGNGEYRSPSGYRHRHKDALVQVANELASASLCDVLIPSAHADPAAYSKAFLARLSQAVQVMRSKHDEALLCVIIDAADNAEMAARESGDGKSFARDLLRERMPDGVRLVLLSRPYRVEMLSPPPNFQLLDLATFTNLETAANLRSVFPKANDHDVEEFHRLSSQNPRVQAAALASRTELPEILRSLGPNPTSVDDMIGALLVAAMSKVKDDAGELGQHQVDRIARAMAVLRPLIPLDVIAKLAEVSESTVRSFVTDLGRPLLLKGDLLQFRDEPTESWFRERYRPVGTSLTQYLHTLMPLADRSVYVAAVLPQLMFEAGEVDALVQLALSSNGLPIGNPIERRDLEMQRLQFALKACLRTKRFTDATKIALKAGGESAADNRQQTLIQVNTDLAARFVSADRMLELVSRRAFSEKWTGAHYAYEACFLSGRRELHADARSRLRVAHEWLNYWMSQPKKERKAITIEDGFVAELALAQFNIHGPKKCIQELSRWQPRSVAFRAGGLVAKRLADQGRFSDLYELAGRAECDSMLNFAVVSVLFESHRLPPPSSIRHAIRISRRSYLKYRESDGFRQNSAAEDAAVALAITGYRHDPESADVLCAILRKTCPVAPTYGVTSRYGGQRLSLLRGYAVLEQFEQKPIPLLDLAPSRLRKEIEGGAKKESSQSVREFYEEVGSLWPWCQLWAKVRLGNISNETLEIEIRQALDLSRKAEGTSYREYLPVVDEIALCWSDILVANAAGPNFWDEFGSWKSSLRQRIGTQTQTKIVWLAARNEGSVAYALEQAPKIFHELVSERADAAASAEAFSLLARAILSVSEDEANEYFKTSIEAAGKIGDENVVRWEALSTLACAAKDLSRPRPELAYQFSRGAELIYDHVDRDKHFNWQRTAESLFGLCVTSGVTILSRWRDRHFGERTRLLAIHVHWLLSQGKLNPWMALAITDFQSEWKYAELLAAILNILTPSLQKRMATQFLYDRMRLERRSKSEWVQFKEIAQSHGIILSQIEDLITESAHREGSRKISGADTDSTSTSRDQKIDWEIPFNGLRIDNAEHIAEAYLRYRGLENSHDLDAFFREAIIRVPLGRESDFVRALSMGVGLSKYKISSALNQVPSTWLARVAVKAAIKELLEQTIRQNWASFFPDEYFNYLSFDRIFSLCGMTKAEVVEILIDAISVSTTALDAGELFRLVSFLALRLDVESAENVLSFGLTLLETEMRESDGDGKWSIALLPPDSLEKAFAGYVWAALAAPEAAQRWEAAHVVRSMCQFGCSEVIDELLALSSSGIGVPFTDSRLYFYRLHALLWLYIALDRSSLDHVEVLVPYLGRFVEVALHGEPHVLIRQFAARAALRVSIGASSDLGAPVQSALRDINQSKQAVVVSNFHDRRRANSKAKKSGDVEKRFMLGYEFKKYEPTNLGEHFAMNETETISMIEDVIWDDWGLTENGHWDRDERGKRKFFERRNGYYRGDGGHSDNLSYYLSFHALMTVAGKLLDTRSLHVDEENELRNFEGWLTNHSLTRRDGFWLSDRRDPLPVASPLLDSAIDEDGWAWSVQRKDFRTHFTKVDGELNVFGGWTTSDGRREESVRVRSALVSTERATSLMRMLQTSKSPYSHHIPQFGEDSEEDDGEFKLKGWVVGQQIEKSLDRYDPWSGDLEYPALSPAPYIVELLGLTSDTEQRSWRVRSDHTSEVLLRCEIWATWNDADEDRDIGPTDEGKILRTSITAMQEILRATSMSLVVEVRIERRIKKYRYERDSDESFHRSYPYTGVMIFHHDGTIESYV